MKKWRNPVAEFGLETADITVAEAVINEYARMRDPCYDAAAAWRKYRGVLREAGWPVRAIAAFKCYVLSMAKDDYYRARKFIREFYNPPARKKPARLRTDWRIREEEKRLKRKAKHA